MKKCLVNNSAILTLLISILFFCAGSGVIKSGTVAVNAISKTQTGNWKYLVGGVLIAYSIYVFFLFTKLVTKCLKQEKH